MKTPGKAKQSRYMSGQLISWRTCGSVPEDNHHQSAVRRLSGRAREMYRAGRIGRSRLREWAVPASGNGLSRLREWAVPQAGCHRCSKWTRHSGSGEGRPKQQAQKRPTRVGLQRWPCSTQHKIGPQTAIRGPDRQTKERTVLHICHPMHSCSLKGGKMSKWPKILSLFDHFSHFLSLSITA